MSMTAKANAVPPASPLPDGFWLDAANVALLAGLAVYFATASWRKWPDPLIDYGRELYIPWRLSQGALLYRDVDHLYGPFTPYFNSMLFRVGGAGLMTMVKANLAILAATIGLLYCLVRAGWGRWAALVSGAVFVTVFSFTQMVGIGNYNFITPYSTEMTHGFLLVLGLIAALLGCLRRLDAARVFGAGLLAGMAVLMKPEVMLAAGATTLGAMLLLLRRDFHQRSWAQWSRVGLFFTAGGFTPMLLTALLFWLGARVSPRDALSYANNAWLNLLAHSNIAGTAWQMNLMGTDRLWGNLGNEVMWGGMAMVCGASLALLSQRLAAAGQAQRGFMLLFMLAAGAFLVRFVPWTNGLGDYLFRALHRLPADNDRWPGSRIGAALPGLLLGAALLEGCRIKSAVTPAADDKTAVRVLLWLSAAAFLARMAFNPRIFHYGFVQAAMAAVVGVATLAEALPEYLGIEGTARMWHRSLLSALLLCGSGAIAHDSNLVYSLKTQPVGFGADAFYTLDAKIDPTGLLIQEALKFLSSDPGAHSMIMLPEGVMVNYLARVPGPIPQYFFHPDLLAGGRDKNILQTLQAAPPDRIIEISRNLGEYGVKRYGESPEHGSALVAFTDRNYDLVKAWGGDPFDVQTYGMRIYARKERAPDLPGGPRTEPRKESRL